MEKVGECGLMWSREESSDDPKSSATTDIRPAIGIDAGLPAVLTFDFRAFCQTETHDRADVSCTSVEDQLF
jgi:hypothetical protein